MSVKGILVATLSTAALFAATTATAATAAPRNRTVVVTAVNPEDVVQKTVGYADLNLASATGEKKLVKRVRFAVSDVCMSAVGGRTGYLLNASNDCNSQSWQSASVQVDRAVQRARDIAANGWSAIAPVAITISAQTGSAQ